MIPIEVLAELEQYAVEADDELTGEAVVRWLAERGQLTNAEDLGQEGRMAAALGHFNAKSALYAAAAHMDRSCVVLPFAVSDAELRRLSR